MDLDYLLADLALVACNNIKILHPGTVITSDRMVEQQMDGGSQHLVRILEISCAFRTLACADCLIII
jgi:hypothetical protein